MSLPTGKSIEAGTSILFLGAGFSAEATNINDVPIKDVSGLIKTLLDEIGEPADGYDLDTAAEEYVRYHGASGPEKITRLLHSNFRSKAYTEDQRLVVCQPWYRIYTTNYDDVIESICSEAKKPITTREISDPVSAPMVDTTQLIHIYGNITRASADEFKRNFLLTETQRDESPFLRSPWMRRFRDDVLTAKNLLFVGFSLTDIDLRRLLGALPREVLGKVHFIARPSTSRPILTRMGKYGTAHAIGLSALAKELGIKRTGSPVREYTAVPMELKELHFTPQLASSVSSRQIENLMISGDVDLKLMSQADISGDAGSYTISRSKNAYHRALTNSSSARPILIHSDIGNGKTIFSSQLGYQFSQQKYRVFRVDREPENIGDVLSFFQALDGPALVIFDDVMRFKELPAAIMDMKRDGTIVVATVRSIVVDTNNERVRSRLGNVTPIEIDLNSPQREESTRIVTYLNENGLLGKNADWSDKEKFDFVEKTCGGQLRDIILSLYETGSLHRRVEDLLANIQALDKGAINVIGLGALLSFADFSSLAKFANVSELTEYPHGIEDFRQALADHELSTLVRLDAGDVVIRSPALAHFILTRIFNIEGVLQLVKESLHILDRYFRDDHDFVRLGKALLKFSLYGQMLNGKRDNDIIRTFYDDCRTLSFSATDPLFWVQRSICEMHDKQFPISERFVDNAYALAKKIRKFDPYQIENHHARLMLTHSLEVGVGPTAAREQDAMALLKSVLSRKEDDLYHPLSVMRLYADIVSKWQHTLSTTQKKALKKTVDEAVTSVSKFRQSGRFRNLPELKRRLAEASRRLS